MILTWGTTYQTALCFLSTITLSYVPFTLKEELVLVTSALPFKGIFTNRVLFLDTTSISVERKSEFSVIPRQKVLLFPESKTVYFLTFNSVILFFFNLSGTDAEFDLRATFRTAFSYTNLLLFPLKYT